VIKEYIKATHLVSVEQPSMCPNYQVISGDGAGRLCGWKSGYFRHGWKDKMGCDSFTHTVALRGASSLPGIRPSAINHLKQRFTQVQ
jgi:hypothetical protein